MSLRAVACAAGCALVAWAAACSSSSSPASPQGSSDAATDVDAQSCPPPSPTGDLPCDVSAVFQMHCQHCHTTPMLPAPDHAPFNLRTYEDLTAPFGITDLRRWQRVAQVIEPNNFPHMPPAGQPQLTDSDFTTLRNWFAKCAPGLPEGTGCDISEGAGDASSSDAPGEDGPGPSVDAPGGDAGESGASDATSGG